MNHILERFSFNFFSGLQTKVLVRVNLISKILQCKEVDQHTAVRLLNCVIKNVTACRNGFNAAKVAAHALCETWEGNKKTFEGTRVKKVKRHFDELSQDK